MILFLLLFLFFRFLPMSGSKDFKPSVSPSRDLPIEDFFRSYWQRPVPLQGSPPVSFTEKEASLSPEACGSCHPQQYADWKDSLHSKAMGAGPWGQILDLEKTSPDQAIPCMTCHAPLSEQMPTVETTSGDGQKAYAKNPRFDAQLQLQGITCAACHVRQHQRFGPPKTEGPAATQYPSGMPNHSGAKRSPYFEKAEFCRDCHQFDPENTTLLVNGKPLQDTFREWQSSLWGQGGAACQQCHMPKRRHLWRGIHDPEMVKNGVQVSAQIAPTAPSPGAGPELNVEVKNSAVGHKFPTYVTPKVFVRAELWDHAGKALPGSQQEKVIGWDVRFENGEWKEYFDTRVPPGESFRSTFQWKQARGAKTVRAWVEVHPDHFYHVHFYPAYLKDEKLSPEGRKLVERALRDSGRTPYILFDRVISLTP